LVGFASIYFDPSDHGSGRQDNHISGIEMYSTLDMYVPEWNYSFRGAIH
jgi:hypothetical protein